MSLPRQIPSHSSSPPKSSLRRTSGTQNPTPRTLLPSPHFEEPLPQSSHRSLHNRNLEYEEAIEEESTEFEPPPLQPFFALVEDNITNEHHHPTVHYIFADDDVDIITEAGFRSLGQDDFGSSHVAEERLGTEQGEEVYEEESKLPPVEHNVREHYLIVDVQPDSTRQGYEVTSAQSLSSEWQVLRTSISNAPTIDEGTPDVDNGLMLKIEGRAYTPPEEETTKVRAEGAKDSLEEMVERFQKRLDDIKKTMGPSGQFGIGRSDEHLVE